MLTYEKMTSTFMNRIKISGLIYSRLGFTLIENLDVTTV